MRPSNAPQTGAPIMPLIRLCELEKSYRVTAGKVTALHAVNLAIGSGEFVTITGKSGAGKSTLVNMITGIDQPDSGEIFVADTAVHQLDADRRSRWRGRTLGVVFQFFQLLPSISLLKNVVLPMELLNSIPAKERLDRARDLLDQVGLAGHMHKRPSEISGGQQQRVAIARALANDPPIVVADEPTGNLDSRTSAEIVDLFSKLVEAGKTVIIVTHDRGLAKQASRRFEITDGRIAFMHEVDRDPVQAESGV